MVEFEDDLRDADEAEHDEEDGEVEDEQESRVPEVGSNAATEVTYKYKGMLQK